MKIVFTFWASLIPLALADLSPPILKSIKFDKNEYSIIDGLVSDRKVVAWGNFTNRINSTGWSHLEIKTSRIFPDDMQAYAAGFLEGFLTNEILYYHWVNTVRGYCDGKERICEGVKGFLKTNSEFISSMTRKETRKKSSYWHHVGLFYDQLKGITSGYNSVASDKRSINASDIYWMNIFGDLEDLEQVFAHRYNETIKDIVFGSGSCSALIRLLPGNADLFASHDTWNSYQSMLRILKRYSFKFHWVLNKYDESRLSFHHHNKLIPGRSMSFSGYPGVIFSGDDFTLMPLSGLCTIETTIGNSNSSLWKHVKANGTVLEGIRATIANRLARTGRQWVSLFSKRNSGTYNNQWMVVDYKRFKPGKSEILPSLLWVLEQIPGHIHYADVTGVLKKKGYWPSYNTPYFKDIFNMSGGPANVAKFGDWFSYEKTPRALIFKRDAPGVKDINSMIKLMRYNDFRNDPLSRCNCTPPYSAENAISARNDLNLKNGTYPFGALGHRSHGGTDMKLTTSEMFRSGRFIAAGGPTHESLEPFQWSKTDFAKDTPHVGHPDKWEFDPIMHKWDQFFD